MSLTINNNLMAQNAARNLSEAYGRLGTSTQRLSSGLRINSAADDAAGLAIRELMRAEISSMRQGIRNANDAISMIQTADGALAVIDEKLIRMKELATQAATGTYNSDQRLIIDSEYQAMASEITRIANATKFNGIYLLNGNISSPATNSADWGIGINDGEGRHDGSGLSSRGPLKIHFGPSNSSAEDYYYIAIGNSTASALGVGNASDRTRAYGPNVEASGGFSISTQQGAQQALDALENAILSKDNIRASLGALQNRLANTITNLSIQAENLQAAESRISDADVALEMTEFVRNQIITQAAVAMLAQANALPRMAMQLISG
ncbi:flagellin [Desulfonatronum thioautotrophicum]|uniref:flagellin N-terminal helical domain-containing protein n=1 Tax=Desulfonatronum thioautotrophicum TaxID=617001 RepID=UPI0005EBB48D|nr:flagellin [Desulfonatronum thioautotrophicum]